MKTLVIFGGRFQPFHKGHKASYDHLVDKYGANSVYIVSAEKEPGPDDPFTWDEKKRLAVHTGVPTDKFVQVSNPYNMAPIIDALPVDPEDTIIILSISEKDNDRFGGHGTDDEGYTLKKDGSRAPIQPLRADAQPAASGHMYTYVTPTVEFPVAGQKVKGSKQIRAMYSTATPKKRKQILTDLYPTVKPGIQKLFNKRIGVIQTESLLREFTEFVNKF